MNNYIYILVMAITVFVIRTTPLLLIKKKIENKYIKSFLYYVPYVTLAVMVFPGIIDSTSIKIAGIASLLLGILASYKGLNMFKVTVICCLTVFIIELFAK